MTMHDPKQIRELRDPAPIEWRAAPGCIEAVINGFMVAWIEARPGYCDRGHFKMVCNLPGIDGADGFPRYYMRREVAILETEEWLRWRLWEQDISKDKLVLVPDVPLTGQDTPVGKRMAGRR